MPKSRRILSSWCILLLSSVVASCGSDSDPEAFEALDPTQPQYGKTVQEWAAEWVYYVDGHGAPLCDDPIKNPTGATCADGQDPESPVFFLVGTYGGPAVRKDCVVPKDAALFFPLTNVWADKAGMPEDMVLSSEALKGLVESYVPSFLEDSFYVTVDGRPLADPGAGYFQEAAPYRIHIPEGPNRYTCVDQVVSGDFDGYVVGAWVMLPPLGPGKHVVEFGSAMKASASTAASQVDVRYELTVASES